jgi:NifU-like protein involved in Fe-S cluster formation
MLKKKTLEDLLLKAGYSAKAVKLYLNKVNVGLIEHPDVVSTYTGLLCGDSITLYLKLENETIQDARFEYVGCVGTATSGSAVTLLLERKTIEEAWKINKEDVINYLDGLPESHCADLAVNAMRQALAGCKKQVG